jgi:hypothetical protein
LGSLTVEEFEREIQKRSYNFQLPLSGSLGLLLWFGARQEFLFQLPLSGSPLMIADVKQKLLQRLLQHLLSTPSLGITVVLPRVALGSHHRRLSTPSLGITEPDSGIFRLSAAFCRGAPSHK